MWDPPGTYFSSIETWNIGVRLIGWVIVQAHKLPCRLVWAPRMGQCISDSPCTASQITCLLWLERISGRCVPRRQNWHPYTIGLHMPSVYPEVLIAFVVSTQPSARSLEEIWGLLWMTHCQLANTSAICTVCHTKPWMVRSQYYPSNCYYM